MEMPSPYFTVRSISNLRKINSSNTGAHRTVTKKAGRGLTPSIMVRMEFSTPDPLRRPMSQVQNRPARLLKYIME